MCLRRFNLFRNAQTFVPRPIYSVSRNRRTASRVIYSITFCLDVLNCDHKYSKRVKTSPRANSEIESHYYRGAAGIMSFKNFKSEYIIRGFQREIFRI